MSKKDLLLFLFPLGLIGFSATGVHCKKSSAPSLNTDTTVTRQVQQLPSRQAKVYIGIADRWHEMADPVNYSRWEFVRTNAAGFYTNFIAMWINNYQNVEDPQQSCNDMRSAFHNGGCFFETSMETKVNDAPNGGNNESTDKLTLDQLTAAGFNVEYTSLNYGIGASRVNTLKTYQGKRSCLTLVGPWTIGGNILTDTIPGNAATRTNILATDGMQTDGPLGYWSVDQQHMQEGSYSLVYFGNSNHKTSAIMLAPFDAGIGSYNQNRDFLNVSKQCVLGHEDHYASPDIWTIWTYGQLPDEPTFPESIVDASGITVPANTMMGVGYWLLRHLTGLPAAKLASAVSGNGTVTVTGNDSTRIGVDISKGGDGIRKYSLPVILSNAADPAIELSPVVQAVLSGDQKDWTVRFMINGTEVTENILYKGGLNCIGALRLSSANRLTLTLEIRANSSAVSPGPLTITLVGMSNLSNTQHSQTAATIVAKAL